MGASPPKGRVVTADPAVVALLADAEQALTQAAQTANQPGHNNQPVAGPAAVAIGGIAQLVGAVREWVEAQ